jgi:acetyl-CoA carboxylase carboxyltransferase component
MCSKDLGADFVWAWPSAEIAVMGPEGAVDVVFRKEIAEAEDSVKKREELIAGYREKFANPYDAATKLYIDDVIEPHETREKLTRALELLAGKRESRPMKKHGNIPL